jgi:hypothetical protein
VRWPHPTVRAAVDLPNLTVQLAEILTIKILHLYRYQMVLVVVVGWSVLVGWGVHVRFAKVEEVRGWPGNRGESVLEAIFGDKSRNLCRDLPNLG